MLCAICGYEVLKERITYYRTSFHPICFVNRIKQIRKQKGPNETIQVSDVAACLAGPLHGNPNNLRHPNS
jgi:hypothetical protein